VSSKAFSAPDLFTDLRIGSNRHRRHSPTSIHILNDDLLLNIFHFYQLAHGLEEYENEGFQFMAEPRIPLANQFHRHWWYNLAHVCRRWRNLILASPYWLKLQLVCTFGVPVADMLAHSPPLPLTIYYNHIYRRRIPTPEDELDMLLALLHRDRVRHVCLSSQRLGSDLENVITAMGGEFQSWNSYISTMCQ
jgi:F-box-like